MEKTRYILVTGGAGYIGSHTVVDLFKKGFTPVILDDFRNADSDVIQRLEKLTGQSILMYPYACQDPAVSALFEKYQFEGVIHFAADKAVGESVQNPLKYYDNNLSGLIDLLKLVEMYQVPKFIFSSSCTVYGEPEVSEVSEETPKQLPNSPYGFTKWIGEQIIQDWSAVNETTRVVCLRYFNPIGAHESGMIGEAPQGIPNNLLPYLTQTALGLRKQLSVFGNDYPTPDGTCIRDYIHVCDVSDAHVKALDFIANTAEKLAYFNLGTGKGSSVLEVIETFEAVSGMKLNWVFAPKRVGDVVQIYANVDKAKKVLNWVARYTLKDAIRDAWNWEQKNQQNG